MRFFFWILLLSLVPFYAYSKVGDLYYCEMTQAIEIKEGKIINYIPQKFKFRVINENLIQFGSRDQIQKTRFQALCCRFFQQA